MKIIITAFIILFTTIEAYGIPDYIYCSVPGQVQFNITNPDGLITGYTQNGILSQIPYMPSYVEHYPVEVDPEAPIDNTKKYHTITYSNDIPATAGVYKITLFGMQNSTTINVFIEVRWSENIYNGAKYNNNINLYPNSVWTYEFNIPTISSANQQIVLTKVSNPTDLITDINTSNQLGYLGTPGTYQSLLAKAQDAQAKVAAGQPIPAKNVLNALINDINAQRGKQINTIAADILIEDAQYIINHI